MSLVDKVACAIYNTAPERERDGSETWIVPWIDVKHSYPATFESCVLAAMAAITAVSESLIASLEENVATPPASPAYDEMLQLSKPCNITDPSTRDCPNMKEVGGGMDGERYKCVVCGKGYFLDYEDMK